MSRKQNNSLTAFFALLKAGLWDAEVRVSLGEETVWPEIYRISSEQSVLGIVLAGLEHSSAKPPQELLLQWIGEVQSTEQRNRAIDEFIAKLIYKLRVADVYTLLVKGQGVAQCYEKPLWRVSGDIDLLMSKENYERAFPLLAGIAEKVDDEKGRNRHIALIIEGWTVEMHGTLRSGLWKKIDRELDEVQDSVFYNGKVRSWMNGSTQVFLPRVDEDVVFVFSHILQHFYKEGIGLRQICDWCRLLWTYRDSLNHRLLEKRIRRMGLMTEWKAFAALAVDFLGIPKEAMPFYSISSRWSCKASRVIHFVLETGNFGHKRDYSYYQKYPFVVYKSISAWRHFVDFGRYFVIFPLDAIKVTWNRMCLGVSVALLGKRHE